MAASSTHWHILGAGSLGCLWATCLARAGHSVTLLLRPQAYQQFIQQGLRLERDGHTQPIAVNAERIDTAGAPIDALLVATKAYDCLPALAGIEQRLTPATQILLLQNGMGAQQAVQQRYPANPVFCASSTDGAFRRERFHVVHAGRGQTWLGSLQPQPPHCLQRLQQTLSGLELTLQMTDDIALRLWHKLAINAAINPLTALHRCRNGELAQPPYRETVGQLCRETAAILDALSIPEPDGGVLGLALQVIEATAANTSSMLQDIMQGKRTEIDYINGYIVQQGEQLGIDTPTHRCMTERVKQLCPAASDETQSGRHPLGV